MDDNERVTYFGETDARNKRVRFGIKKKDRSRHMYVIGKTGMGKSTLLENLAIQDIQNGEGLAFIDPHGKTADLLLEYVPEHRIKDVIYFAPFDLDHPISFNVLEDVGAEKRHLVVNGLMSAFKRIWVDAFSARMEYILSNIMLALLEYPGSTLMGVNRMLVDKEFRTTVVNNITDPSVRSFWVDEYAKYTDKFAAEAAPAIQNKVGQFVANPLVRNIIGQEKSSFDIRAIMDQKKILIINLSKGRVGEANANLLGAMIITKIYLAAMSRADMSESELKKAAEFYLYVDEFQSFANESFADILSEARKYKLALIIAHQYIEQMTEEVRAAVFGNVGTMAVYRVGAYDAAVFEKEFVPQFSAEDLVNLQQYQLYLKLMIDGVTSPPFSAMGMTPIQRPPQTYVKEIIESSRAQFAKPREEVEDHIRQWHIDKIPPGPNAPAQAAAHGGGHGGGLGQTGGNQNGYAGDRPRRDDGAPRSSGSNGDRPPRRDFGQSGQGQGQEIGQRSSGFGDRNGGDRSGRIGERHGDRSGPRPGDRMGDSRGDRGDRPRRDDGHGPRDGGTSTARPFAKAFEALLSGEKVEGIEEQNAMESHDDSQRVSPDVSSAGNASAQVDREKSLRDAISLNYLKSRNEEEQKARNAAKEAKPQNILDLKNALLGILNEQGAQPAASPQAQSQPNPEPQPQPQQADRVQQAQQPVQAAPVPPTQQNAQHAPQAANPRPEHHHPKPQPQPHHAERQHPHSAERAQQHHQQQQQHASAHPANNHHAKDHAAPRSNQHHDQPREKPMEPKPHAQQTAEASEVDFDTLSKLLG